MDVSVSPATTFEGPNKMNAKQLFAQALENFIKNCHRETTSRRLGRTPNFLSNVLYAVQAGNPIRQGTADDLYRAFPLLKESVEMGMVEAPKISIQTGATPERMAVVRQARKPKAKLNRPVPMKTVSQAEFTALKAKLRKAFPTFNF